MISKLLCVTLAVGGWLVLTGCAPEVVRTPVAFSAAGEDGQATVRIRQATSVTPSTGYTKTIKAGSAWRRVGTLPQGSVYRPVGDVFAVEGANMHEAYLVVAEGQLVGFYLVGERAFAPLADKVPLPME